MTDEKHFHDQDDLYAEQAAARARRRCRNAGIDPATLVVDLTDEQVDAFKAELKREKCQHDGDVYRTGLLVYCSFCNAQMN
jgi:hypothetical protein